MSSSHLISIIEIKTVLTERGYIFCTYTLEVGGRLFGHVFLAYVVSPVLVCLLGSIMRQIWHRHECNICEK